MSTFSLLLLLLFLVIFGLRIFMYCVNMDMPRLSGFLTLMLLLLILAEIILATFEFPAIVIDGVVFISMGNEIIAVGCGIVTVIVLAFVFIMIYPRIPWIKVLSFSPIKFIILGAILLSLTVYTELFNGSYSFDSMDEYNSFKQSFSQYDVHFWPTKYIKRTEDNGREFTVTYSVYPWDVNLPDGKQFAYKVITFYSSEEGQEGLYYYPFTFKLYAGVDPVSITQTDANRAVSDSDLQEISRSDAVG